MKKFLAPLTVLGLGSLGAFLFSERGQQTLHWFRENVWDREEGLSEWNEAAQSELERLKEAVNQLSATIAAAR